MLFLQKSWEISKLRGKKVGLREVSLPVIRQLVNVWYVCFDSCLSHYFQKTFVSWVKTVDKDQLQNFLYFFERENDNLEKVKFLQDQVLQRSTFVSERGEIYWLWQFGGH